MKARQQALTLAEAEANRRDPAWGCPVQDLALHAAHWLEVAVARCPGREPEITVLSRRLDEATGDLAEDDTFGPLPATVTEGEVAHALGIIVEIMREIAPLVRDPTRQH